MKRVFVLALMVLSTVTGYGQVVINEAQQTRDPNEKFINGISTRSDIGGVDIEYVTAPYSYKGCPNCDTQRLTSITALKATNYNSFPVTFLYQYTLYSTVPDYYYDTGYDRGQQNPKFGYMKSSYYYQTITGSVVIPPAKGDNYPSKVINNVSGNGGTPIEVRGLITITRKVGQ